MDKSLQNLLSVAALLVIGILGFKIGNFAKEELRFYNMLKEYSCTQQHYFGASTNFGVIIPDGSVDWTPPLKRIYGCVNPQTGNVVVIAR